MRALDEAHNAARDEEADEAVVGGGLACGTLHRLEVACELSVATYNVQHKASRLSRTGLLVKHHHH